MIVIIASVVRLPIAEILKDTRSIEDTRPLSASIYLGILSDTQMTDQAVSARHITFDFETDKFDFLDK